MLGVKCVVHVGVETAVLGEVRCNRERTHVLEVDHRRGDGSLVFVHRAAADLSPFRARRALPGTRRKGPIESVSRKKIAVESFIRNS